MAPPHRHRRLDVRGSEPFKERSFALSGRRESLINSNRPKGRLRPPAMSAWGVEVTAPGEAVQEATERAVPAWAVAQAPSSEEVEWVEDSREVGAPPLVAAGEQGEIRLVPLIWVAHRMRRPEQARPDRGSSEPAEVEVRAMRLEEPEASVRPVEQGPVRVVRERSSPQGPHQCVVCQTQTFEENRRTLGQEAPCCCE